MSTSPTPQVVTMIEKAQLVTLCQTFGANLDSALFDTDDGSGDRIKGAQLLWAMSGQESSFGRNMTPRHEPSYDVGGFYYNKQNAGGQAIRDGIAKWGRAFACSYGPLQILAINAKGFTPVELAASPEKALSAAVAQLRIEILGRQCAKTLAEICDAWNTGNWRDVNVPQAYIEHVTHWYLTEVLG